MRYNSLLSKNQEAALHAWQAESGGSTASGLAIYGPATVGMAGGTLRNSGTALYSFSQLWSGVGRYASRLLVTWLLLLALSYQFTQVRTHPFEPSPVESVLKAVEADLFSYDLLLWTERRVPVRSTQFGDLKSLTENIARKIGLELSTVTRDAHTSGSVWTYRITGQLGADMVEISATWISPTTVAGNNQITSVRARGCESDLVSLQRKLESGLARATGRPAKAEVNVTGRFRTRQNSWELASKLQRKLSRHPFSGLITQVVYTQEDLEKMGGFQATSRDGKTGSAIEGWANVPGHRQLYFSLMWNKGNDDGVVRVSLFPHSQQGMFAHRLPDGYNPKDW